MKCSAQANRSLDGFPGLGFNDIPNKYSDAAVMVTSWVVWNGLSDYSL